MVSFSSKGSFSNTENFLNRMTKRQIFSALDEYGQKGVAALVSATPVDSGISSESWSYEVEKSGNNYTIRWLNRHVDETGTPIVILIQYGHGTGNGGYVQGRDFINPAIQPIFDEIADSVWKEVTS